MSRHRSVEGIDFGIIRKIEEYVCVARAASIISRKILHKYVHAGKFTFGFILFLCNLIYLFVFLFIYVM